MLGIDMLASVSEYGVQSMYRRLLCRKKAMLLVSLNSSTSQGIDLALLFLHVSREDLVFGGWHVRN